MTHGVLAGTHCSWFSELFDPSRRTSGASLGSRFWAASSGFTPCIATAVAASSSWSGGARLCSAAGAIGPIGVAFPRGTWARTRTVMVAPSPPLHPPPPLVLGDARERIRAAGKRIAVLDDDPTGSQTVHDVAIVTALDDDALQLSGGTTFFLTNTRSLPEAEAVELTERVARRLLQQHPDVELISRSDSTLRGHVVAEVRAADRARRAVVGSGYDGVLLVPAFFEAGRFTAGDIHWARVGDEIVPVGETEFAKDATFGYSASNLREFVAEKSGAGDALSLSLDDIRVGGIARVSEILRGVGGGRWVVVNALDYSDLEVVVLGLQASGRSFLYRTGPSFVRALAGLEPKEPLNAGDIWPDGRPSGNGLVVVGSHVGLTSRQVAAARTRGGLREIELDVDTLDSGDVGRRVKEALADEDVLVYTSRTLKRGADADDSLAIARRVSTAVTEVVQAALEARPAWVIAKGGITSHDVAVRGLGIRRAEVLGQLLNGMVSVFRPLEAHEGAVGTPYVVFAGNVGDEQTLADIVERFRG